MADLQDTLAWQSLTHSKQEWDASKTSLRDLFEQEPHRATSYSLQSADLWIDYSKNLVNQTILDQLFQLAREQSVEAKRDAMFDGQKINTTEQRSVLHTALRNRSSEPVLVDGQDVMPDVRRVLEHMAQFADTVRSRQWLGATGKPVVNIINIGIGGSDLGPVMAYEALRNYSDRSLTVRFVSNVDGSHFFEATRDLDPAETLFIISSKTFTTDETMTNASTARQWVVDALGDHH
jgi:glucose-6-phosphate isomerase